MQLLEVMHVCQYVFAAVMEKNLQSLSTCWSWALVPMEKLSLKIDSVLVLCRWPVWADGGTCTQSKGVMFQFNKDLFLFSLEEEGNEEVESHMGAAIAAAAAA